MLFLTWAPINHGFGFGMEAVHSLVSFFSSGGGGGGEGGLGCWGGWRDWAQFGRTLRPLNEMNPEALKTWVQPVPQGSLSSTDF